MRGCVNSESVKEELCHQVPTNKSNYQYLHTIAQYRVLSPRTVREPVTPGMAVDYDLVLEEIGQLGPWQVWGRSVHRVLALYSRLSQGIDGSARKPALRQDTGYVVEKTYHDIAPYLGAFGAYLMPQ